MRALIALGAAVVLLAGSATSYAAPSRDQSATTAATAITAATTTTPSGIDVGPPLPAPRDDPGSGDQVDGGGKSSPGFFDFPGKVREAVNGWFRGLVKDALNPAMKLVGKTLLATPQISQQPRVRELWLVSLAIADALLVLAIVVAGAVLMGHETLQSRYAVKDILPRLVVGGIAANASLAICAQMIAIANALSVGFLSGGVDPERATERLAALVVAQVTSGGIFLILLGLACAAFAVVLLVLYIVRAALIVILVCAAPVMLLCHALPQTEGMARMWWRAMLAALGVQVAQALTLSVALQVLLTPSGHGVLGLSATGGLIDVLIVLCLLWVLLRIPFWAKELAFSQRRSVIAGAAKAYVTGRMVRAAG